MGTQLTENTITAIEYCKSETDRSNRVIIPSFVPKSLVTALDVTGLSSEQQEATLKLWNEYVQYKKGITSQIFPFEQFVEQVSPNANLEIKWRSFDLSKIQ